MFCGHTTERKADIFMSISASQWFTGRWHIGGWSACLVVLLWLVPVLPAWSQDAVAGDFPGELQTTRDEFNEQLESLAQWCDERELELEAWSVRRTIIDRDPSKDAE